MSKATTMLGNREKLQKRLRVLSKAHHLSGSRIRVALYALLEYKFDEFIYIPVSDIADALSMEGTNVSSALSYLERTHPPFLKVEKDGTKKRRKLGAITDNESKASLLAPRKKRMG